MSKNDVRILHIYYLTEMVLFILIKIGEQILRKPGQGDPGVPRSPLAILRYCTIICNFIMILYLYLRHGRGLRFHENLIPIAFALTLTADFFMCIIDEKRIFGYLFFTLVETVYMIYMKPTWKNIFLRVILYAAIFFLLLHIKAKLLTADNAWALANMIQLTINLFSAWIWHRKTGVRETLLFALGITFFAGCDYSILFRTVFVNAPDNPPYRIAAFLAWTCYIPAQMLLLRSYVEKLSKGKQEPMKI